MKTRDMLMYIARELEGRGYDKEDLVTIYGITKKWYPQYYEQLKEVITDDQKLMITLMDIYFKLYDEFKSNLLPFPLDIYHFDFSLNANPKDATYKLQEVYKRVIGDIEVDGIFGKETASKFNKLKGKYKMTVYLYHEYCFSRKYFYLFELHKLRYERGWMARIAKLERLLGLEITNRYIGGKL